MGVYSVTLYSHNTTQTANPFANVFGYETDVDVLSQDDFNLFVSEFQSGPLALIRSVQCLQIQYDSMTMRAVDGSGAEFEFTFSPPPHGTVEQDYLPNFNAWAFEYQRANVGDRSGAKRFAGIPETLQSGGTVSAPTLAVLDSIATSLGLPIVAGTITWTPVILHKTGPSSAVAHPIRGVIFKRISTQNSRKR